MYRSFNAWTAHAFWRMELPPGELPDLVACTDSMVFVYTSRGYLRTWSVSGIQQSILSPCGHVVSMVGNGSQLCLVYEDSYPLEGSRAPLESLIDTANLKMLLYSTAPFRRLHQGPLVLSHKAKLTWLGFTKEGLPATYDSQCVLRVLTGVSVPSEEMLPDEMEWVVLMNVKHYLREQQERGDARTQGEGVRPSSLLLGGGAVAEDDQVRPASLGGRQSPHASATDGDGAGRGDSALRTAGSRTSSVEEGERERRVREVAPAPHVRDGRAVAVAAVEKRAAARAAGLRQVPAASDQRGDWKRTAAPGGVSLLADPHGGGAEEGCDCECRRRRSRVVGAEGWRRRTDCANREAHRCEGELTRSGCHRPCGCWAVV